jgi:hypothetical protein
LVTADRETADVLINAERVGRGEVEVDLPYYGSIEVAAVPSIADTNPIAGTTREPVRKTVRVDPPVSGWFFPLDFVGEVLTYPWRDLETEVRLELPERPGLREGEIPPGTAELRARARQQLLQR